MDVTINVNLTPAEARQLMGLPNVQPLQDAALSRMQDTIMAQAEAFSADGLLNTWFGANANTAIDAFRDAIGGALSQSLAKGKTASKGKESSRE
jgi:Family of unknown function (DUF6489)